MDLYNRLLQQLHRFPKQESSKEMGGKVTLISQLLHSAAVRATT